MTQYTQRGNLTECVQWNGFNVETVASFIQPRLNGSLRGEFDRLEFVKTLFHHLIIVANFSLDEAYIVGKQAITRGTWLVDQGPLPESPLGVVFCEEARFHHLYKAVE